MGGLFGGGSKKEKPPKQELNPPVDTSGSKIPGDDKIAARKADMAMAARTEKAGKTLMGRSANGPKAGSSVAEKPKTVASYG